MFKKGDYIVIQWPDKATNTYLSHNFVYKQEHNRQHLDVEKDNFGGKTSNSSIRFESNKWRYATKAEIDLYNKYYMPVKSLDVSYEIY